MRLKGKQGILQKIYYQQNTESSKSAKSCLKSTKICSFSRELFQIPYGQNARKFEHHINCSYLKCMRYILGMSL